MVSSKILNKQLFNAKKKIFSFFNKTKKNAEVPEEEKKPFGS